MIAARKGRGAKSRRALTGGGEALIKNPRRGFFPYESFFLSRHAVISLYVGAIFSVWRSLSLHWGGGGGAFLGLLSPDNFYLIVVTLFTAQIFIIFPDRGGLNVWGSSFFLFSGGGGGGGG